MHDCIFRVFCFVLVANVNYLWGKDLLFNAIKFYLPSNSFCVPLKRLGNFKENEGNKRIPRSHLEGRNRLIHGGIQDSFIGCRKDLLTSFLYFSKKIYCWPVS